MGTISKLFMWKYFILLTLAGSRSASEHRSARRDGDIILGALFPVHRPPHDKSRYTRSCGEIWEQYGIHRTEMFFLALEDINSNPKILPNITLGWDIRDSCWYSPIALEQSIDFIKTSIASMDEITRNDSLPACGTARKGKPIAGLIGPGSSQNTIIVQNMLQMFHIPQIGYSATSMDLSNKNLYKYFLRVVPSDTYQAQALIDVVLRYNWTYISTVHSEGNYGEKGIEEFRNLAKNRNVCIANAEAAPSVDDDIAFNKIIETLLKTDRARVIVCFCEGMTARRLMMAMKRTPKARKHFQILASDGWADRPDVVSGIEDVAVGAITIKLMSNPIPSFDTYFRSLKPENNSRNPWFREFWQWKFKCYLKWLPKEEQDQTHNRSCTGKETITDLVQDAKLGFVIKAIYALAHALHNMHQNLCGEDSGICENMATLDGAMFLDFLHNVSFSFEKESVFFDENGDPPPRYYIVNYQKHLTWNVNESYKYEMIGSWNSGVLTMDDNRVYWPQYNNGHVTKSICSDDCPKGHVKKVHGNIACCWVCTPCQQDEIMLDSETCLPCSLGWWPNTNLTECVMIPIEYITWWDTEAMVALVTACFGMFVTLWIGIVFIRHNNTPVVKASTRELMYIILIGVMMAFCSNFVLVARPTLVTCYFTRILPGMSFSLIYGALVTKTNRIARILEGTKKIITKKPRFMSASAQVIITCIIIGVECAIITIMLVIEPADSKFDYPAPKRVKLICNTTTMGIIVPLGFDLVLIAMCTLYAIKTRNLPENFNEAKFIGFSMYTTCVIWLGFIAIYFGSERKVITMSVSVSLSAYVALVLLFFPKVYIIIWAPEKNTRSAFTTSKDVRCHIGSISCASGESIDLIRDVKQIDGLKVPAGRRRASFFQRLRYGGTSHHKRHQTMAASKIKRDATGKLRRENSFHVNAGNSSSKGGSFSWAKMSAAGTSEEDRLSTISSKDGSDEVKRKHSLFKRDIGCQTEQELMESLLNMPYLRRRCSQRIQRSRAIDEDSASVKFSPNNSMKVRYHRKMSTEPVKTGKGPAVQQAKSANRGDCRTFLFPGYSDSPLSTSDDIENEEDFEYYDSISDLLKAHKITPVYIDKKTTVCVNDKSMSTYLNPLGNREINESSVEEDSEKPVVNGDNKTPDSDDPDGGVHLVVENNIDGTSTTVLKDSQSSHSPFHVVTVEHNQTGKATDSILVDIPTNQCNQRHSVLNESHNDIPVTSINPKRRSSSPIFSHISCHSLNISECNEQSKRRPSALSQGSHFAPRDSPAQNFPGCKSADDMATTSFVKPVDNEEKSMVEFQTFLRERGVELDMNYIESSDV